MSLSTRGKLPQLNEGVPALEDKGGTGGLLDRDPSSYQYSSSLEIEEVSVHKQAKRLYNYMVAAQTRRYGDTRSITEGAGNSVHRNVPAALKMIKRCLETHTISQIERAVDLACFQSEWPFTLKYVNKVLQTLDSDSQ